MFSSLWQAKGRTMKTKEHLHANRRAFKDIQEQHYVFLK